MNPSEGPITTRALLHEAGRASTLGPHVVGCTRDFTGTNKEKSMNGFARFWREEDGATSVEYALMVALIAVVIIVAVKALGTSVSEKFQEVATKLDAA